MSLVTISQYTVNPPLEIPEGASLETRGYYTRDFIASDGVTPVSGNPYEGQQGFFYSIPTTQNGNSDVVVSAHDVQPTTLSNPTANYFEDLWVDGAFFCHLMPNTNVATGWQIPTIYGSVIAIDEIALYNRAKRLLFPPSTYPTFDEVVLLIQRLAGNFDYMAVGVNGIGQASFPPVVASEPIVLMENDPKVGSWFNVLSYGAVGNGITDDTIAVNVAVATAFAAGGGVYIPVGTFLVGSVNFNVPVMFAPGNSILKRTSGTITIGKSITADMSQHFIATSGQVRFTGNTFFSELYPEWWGAIADGSTDCTAAFNAAIAAFPTVSPGVNGGVLKLGVGNYKITGITITDLQVHIIGSGGIGESGSVTTASTIISSATNAAVITYARGSVHSYRARLEDLAIVANNAGTSQHGVIVDNGGIIINNVSISGCGGNNLFLRHSVVGSYNNLELHNSGIDGIRSQPSTSSDPVTAAVTANTFYHVSIGAVAANQGAVHFLCGAGNSFYGLDIENSVAVTISAISNAAAAEITTSTPHGFTSGQTVSIRGNATFAGTTLGAALVLSPTVGGHVVTKISDTEFTVPVDSSALSGFSGTANVGGARGIWFDHESACTQEVTYNFVYGYWPETNGVDLEFAAQAQNNYVQFTRRTTGEGPPVVVANNPGTGNRYDDYNEYGTSQTLRFTGRTIFGDDSAQVAGSQGLTMSTGDIKFLASDQALSWDAAGLPKIGASTNAVTFLDHAGTGAVAVVLGLATSLFTRIKRNVAGTGIIIRNGDDSLYGDVEAKSLIAAATGLLRITPKTNDVYGAAMTIDVTIGNHYISAVSGTSATVTMTPSGVGTAGDILIITTVTDASGTVTTTFASTFHPLTTQITTASHRSTIIFLSDGGGWNEISRTTNIP